ncbi:hypothetical protein F503_08465 [Ophiostoma piceae UAMH 11346]|uniref:Uncharacterized protein n=1 Tax=Ophiostoma piceae (strain UAMH 11346) TaxID=1262450 RepID=S3BXE4_OPHP1|nr:hypothetical protein F503_08465 [Ophiostoma piceae UAMH 11346]
MSQRRTKDTPLYVQVRGQPVVVPKVYPCFYPDRVIRWKRPPPPDHVDKYFAWGRQHYGEEWYRLRKSMLETRNIYVFRDDAYARRQLELRELENAVDGRLIPGGMEGAVWKHAWLRAKSTSLTNLTNQSPFSQTDNNLDSPYALALDQLQYNRQALEWTDEQYQYYEYLAETKLAADERSQWEDAIGNRQFDLERKLLFDEDRKLKASTLPRNSVAYDRLFDAYERKAARLKKLRSGQPKDSVEEVYARSNELAKERDEAADRLLERGPQTTDELMIKLMHWQKYGHPIEEHELLTRLYGFQPIPRPDYAADSRKYNGYDYLSLCKRTPTSRPWPTEAEFVSLANTWEKGLTLNRREIEELRSMYGFRPTAQDPTPPPPRSPHRSASHRRRKSPESGQACRRSLRIRETREVHSLKCSPPFDWMSSSDFLQCTLPDDQTRRASRPSKQSSRKAGGSWRELNSQPDIPYKWPFAAIPTTGLRSGKCY